MLRFIKGLMVGLVIGLLGLGFHITPFGASFERNTGLNFLFKMRGQINPPEEIAVVAIDNRTGEQLGLKPRPRNWPRSIHAKLIENLVKRGAAVIVFDVYFHAEKSRLHDQQLVDAVEDADRVVLVEQVNGKRQPITNAEGKIVGSVWSEELLKPFPALAGSARGLATFTLPKTEASVYGFWVFKESVGHSPTLPSVALQLFAESGKNTLVDQDQQKPELLRFDLPDKNEQASQADLLTHTMQRMRLRYTEPHPNAVSPEGIDGVSLSPPLELMYQGPGYRFLNFYGPPGTIKTVPYHAVINGSDPNVSEEDLDFSGKVAFVGYSDLYDPGQPDRFYTVFSRDDGIDLSGVEIAATGFANLLNDESISLPSVFQVSASIFVFGLMVGMAAYLFPAVYGILLVLASTGLYVYFVQSSFNGDAQWWPLAVPVLVQLPAALFLGLLGQYFFERKRGMRISQALNYYLPEHAARQLTHRGADQDAFNKVVYSTCFSTDMAGFSSIAEMLGPGELALLLNDYFDTLAAALKKHGVNITEFRADAIMCAWTGEQGSKEITRQPLLAALEAAEAIENYNQRHVNYQTKLRVGLESGTVYIGHAGGGGHFVFSIVGDCANTASRIEGLNKHIGTQILATEEVVKDCKEMLVRYIGDFLFVNKIEASSIYEIIALRDKASPEQLSLCERFSAALHEFQQGRWKQASSLFEEILKHYPNDGPTQFFLNRSKKHQNDVATVVDPRVIRMDLK